MNSYKKKKIFFFIFHLIIRSQLKKGGNPIFKKKAIIKNLSNQKIPITAIKKKILCTTKYFSDWLLKKVEKSQDINSKENKIIIKFLNPINKNIMLL